MTTTATRAFTTYRTVGYTRAVANPENRAAHGGVCHIQFRQRVPGGPIETRRVNTNGRHREVGPCEVATDARFRDVVAAAAADR